MKSLSEAAVMPEDLDSVARTLSLPYYDNALPAHDQLHAKRVSGVANQLANEIDETIDRRILSAAAWLHDIGRPYETIGEIEDHVQWGANEARDLLKDEGIPTEKIDAIHHCIEAHGVRSSSPDPNTLEAQLLFDADKLDAIGAVGILRMASILGERSAQSSDNIGTITNSEVTDGDTDGGLDVSSMRARAKRRLNVLYTEPGHRLGNSRWEFFEEFISQFNTEIGLSIGD